MTTTCLNIFPSLTYEWLAVGENTIFCLRIGICHNCRVFSKNSKTENIHHSHHFHGAHFIAEFPACRNTKDIGSCIFGLFFWPVDHLRIIIMNEKFAFDQRNPHKQTHAQHSCDIFCRISRQIYVLHLSFIQFDSKLKLRESNEFKIFRVSWWSSSSRIIGT